MTLRLTFVILMAMAFALAFALIVDRAENPLGTSPCDEWANPDCEAPPTIQIFPDAP